MSQFGSIQSGEVLDISNIYEMSIFTDANIGCPAPKILCSNDGIIWCEYAEMLKPYMYLAELMANKIKIESADNITLHYNANLKK
jgi:hypothetical protein